MVVAGQLASVTKECLPWIDYAWALMKREEGVIMEDLYSPRVIYRYKKRHLPLVNIKWRACSFLPS
jgi:hypothetical protein